MQTFSSKYGAEKFHGSAQWRATSLQFHRKSEHVVSSVQFDLEMQIHHVPASSSPNLGANRDRNLTGSVISIFFDTHVESGSFSESEVEVIDRFFEALRLEDVAKSAPENQRTPAEGPGSSARTIPLGSLMEDVVKLGQRWVYLGSETAPPCGPRVYWNVVRTIYPIKESQIALFN